MKLKTHHQAFYLCDIPDVHHGQMISIGGIKNVKAFATTNLPVWEKQASTFSKLKPTPVYLNATHQQKLTALSLWARVKIDYGEESDLMDYRGLMWSLSLRMRFVNLKLMMRKTHGPR